MHSEYEGIMTVSMGFTDKQFYLLISDFWAKILLISNFWAKSFC